MVTTFLNRQGDLVEEWRQYVKLLSHGVVKLSEEEDTLKWSKNKGTCGYIVKLGFTIRIEELEW
jgi:hypothetical protein